jgi:uncharacterized membrane protein SpoIIM required for sporulation
LTATVLKKTDSQRWQRFLQQAEKLGSRKRSGLSAVREFLKEYRALEHEINLLPNGHVRSALEGTYLHAQEQLIAPASNFGKDAQHWFFERLPQSFSIIRNALWISLAIFIGFVAVGFLAVRESEELARLFMDPRALADVRDGKLWTDGLFSISPASVLSFQITLNNIIVALFAYAVGTLYGFGTFYALALNGSMLGALFAFTMQYGAGFRLLNFVTAHGVVELFVICVAAACGLHLGDRLIHPGNVPRAESFRLAITETAPVMLYGVLGLMVCGLIEGYVSPNLAIGFPVRVGIGVGWFLLFFAGLSGWFRRAPRAVVQQA